MALINYYNEYGRLEKIALYKPRVDEIYQGEPSTVMYISKPDPAKIIAEFDVIVDKFRELSVEVEVLEDTEEKMANCPNMIYLRDVAAVINEKIILANMKFPVRKPEPAKFRTLLTESNPKYGEFIEDILENDEMEGADVLVTESDRIFAYTGYRTSINAVKKICQLNNLSSNQIPAYIQNIPQHLLGALHIVSDHQIIRRPAYCNADIPGFEYIDLDEDDEVLSGFAMNIVTIAPGEILMSANCPNTRNKLEASGIKCHVVKIEEIHKMGGGLACMTLPLRRER